MLLAIGSSGNTMAARLVSHSGLSTGTVIDHLLVDVVNKVVGYPAIMVFSEVQQIFVSNDVNPIYLFKIDDILFAYTTTDSTTQFNEQSQLLPNIDIAELFVIKSNNDIVCLYSQNDIYLTRPSQIIYAISKYAESVVNSTSNDIDVMISQSDITTSNIESDTTVGYTDS